MRVLFAVAVWGRDYVGTFVNFSLASQLASQNIPALAVRHSVAYHIVTTRRDRKRLEQHANLQMLARYCEILWDEIEDLDYDARQIPGEVDGEKYPFLSRLQNLTFGRSLDFDVVLFNYADFVWSKGSVPYVVGLMSGETDAALGFCLPVDRRSGQKVLRRHQSVSADGVIIDIAARDLSALAVVNLHREVKLRVWDGSRFSSLPTYLLWPIDGGLLVRAYHQTVLALRVRKDDTEYRAGIRYGSLDGYFTALLAEKGNVRHAVDSDAGLIVSLYSTPVDTALLPGDSRDDALRRCLQHSVSAGQRRFAETPILIKGGDVSQDALRRITDESWRTLQVYHRSVDPDPKAFESTYKTFGDIAALESRWRSRTNAMDGSKRRGSNLRIRLYRGVLARLIAGPLGAIFKSTFGGSRARAWRRKLESWVFKDSTKS